jgi:hypothetical protein
MNLRARGMHLSYGFPRGTEPWLIGGRRITIASRESLPLAQFLQPCLVPYPSEKMEMYAVSLLVDKPGVDEAECIKPLSV